MMAKAKNEHTDRTRPLSARTCCNSPPTPRISSTGQPSVPKPPSMRRKRKCSVIDGSGTLVTAEAGRLRRSPPSSRAGTHRTSPKGDFIGERTPHWFNKINGTLVLMSLHAPRPVPAPWIWIALRASKRCMDAAETRQLLESLETGREALLTAVAGLTERLAPEPGQWSVTLRGASVSGEHYLLCPDHCGPDFRNAVRGDARAPHSSARSRQNPAGSKRPKWPGPTDASQRLPKPLTFIDSGTMKLVRFVDALTEDPRAQATSHPLIGPANCYEMLLIIAIHPHRHVSQIREIREAISRR